MTTITILENKRLKKANDKRRERAQKGIQIFGSKPLRSRVLKYGDKKNQRKVKQLLKKATKEVLTNYFEDHLKRPAGMNCARSAKMAYPSFNIYFGRNAGEASNGVVDRFAYGTGTGTQTIGLDSQTMRFNHYLPVFDQILAAIPAVEPSSFNACSIKGYYKLCEGVKTNRVKQTCIHVDVNYTKKDEPAVENSQVPGSPVLMLTFGGEKLLYFCLGKSTHNLRKTTEFSILQKDCHGIYLDGADENPTELGWRWFHRSTMHPDNREGMVISFMFRQVRSTRKVNVEDGTLADPGPDDPVFASVRDTYQNDTDYKKAMKEIDSKARKLITRKLET